MIYIWFKPDPGKIMPIWQDPDLQHCWNVQLWPTDPSTDPDPDPALFISGFKDTNKKYFCIGILFIVLSKATYIYIMLQRQKKS
jgi:hypothetical protein